MKKQKTTKTKKNEEFFLEEIKERLFNSEFKKINRGFIRALLGGGFIFG